MSLHKTTCKIGACEPFCGLEIEVKDGKLNSVQPDHNHPITAGYACIKGMHVVNHQNDHDPLLQPLKRATTGWERVSWPTAISAIGKKLRAIGDEHVPRAIATYWGNAADSISITLANMDLFLLIGMIHWIIKCKAYTRIFIDKYTSWFNAWRELASEVDLDRIAKITDMPREKIAGLADEFAAAAGAFVTTRVGVQTSHNANLTEWAVMALNAITGNLDRPGVVYFNPGVIDIPALIEKFTRRNNKATARIGGYRQIFGGPTLNIWQPMAGQL